VTGNLSGPVVAIAEGALYEGAISRPRKTQVTRYNERRGRARPRFGLNACRRLPCLLPRFRNG